MLLSRSSVLLLHLLYATQLSCICDEDPGPTAAEKCCAPIETEAVDELAVRMVEGHVLAKRYLTYAEPDYYGKLSRGSKTTLKFQGGPMSAEEAEAFRASDSFDACLTMRRAAPSRRDTSLLVGAPRATRDGRRPAAEPPLDAGRGDAATC